MPALLQNLLISHILLGLVGIGFFVAVLVALMKKEPCVKFLKITSLLGLLGFLGSWISGGYYYVTYYGTAVKPIIKAGEYLWAHKVVMETKEHAFLFLPFLAAAVLLAVWLYGDRFSKDKKIKNAVSFLALIIVLLGIAITSMGMTISGAGNPSEEKHDHESHEHNSH